MSNELRWSDTAGRSGRTRIELVLKGSTYVGPISPLGDYVVGYSASRRSHPARLSSSYPFFENRLQ
jgi:hypothetical protein